VYGANYQRNTVNGKSLIPPLPLLYPAMPIFFSSSIVLEDFQFFFNDEWRITPRWLLNIGEMLERDDADHKNISPRIALNFHLTPLHTFRAGISVAYRTPALTEANTPTVQPGVLFIPNATVNSPGLSSEKLVSHEIGYIGEFPGYKTLLDFRLFSDQFSNGIFANSSTGTFTNGLTAEYRGFEATVKKSWDEAGRLTFNFAHDFANSNAATFSSLTSQANWTNDRLAASIPKNSASLLYSSRLTDQCSFSASYYYQGFLQPYDRPSFDFQPTQHRVDARVVRKFQDVGGLRGEVALVVQNVFKTDYTEYIASNLFNQRAYVIVKLNW